MDAGAMRPLNPAEVQAASSLSSAQGSPAAGSSPGVDLRKASVLAPLWLQRHFLLWPSCTTDVCRLTGLTVSKAACHKILGLPVHE